MMAMVRRFRARRSALQHGRPVWAEPTMLAELHVLKFPAGIVGSPPADGRRARRPAKPANYIVVMVRCASSGVVPRIVLSARRLGRADSVNQIGRLLRGQSPRRAHRLLRPRRVLSANRAGRSGLSARPQFPARYTDGAAQLANCNPAASASRRAQAAISA